jgi:hypothetical protein
MNWRILSNDGHYLQGATKLVRYWQHAYGSLIFGYLVPESRTNNWQRLWIDRNKWCIRYIQGQKIIRSEYHLKSSPSTSTFRPHNVCLLCLRESRLKSSSFKRTKYSEVKRPLMTSGIYPNKLTSLGLACHPPRRLFASCPSTVWSSFCSSC